MWLSLLWTPDAYKHAYLGRMADKVSDGLLTGEWNFGTAHMEGAPSTLPPSHPPALRYHPQKKTCTYSVSILQLLEYPLSEQLREERQREGFVDWILGFRPRNSNRQGEQEKEEPWRFHPCRSVYCTCTSPHPVMVQYTVPAVVSPSLPGLTYLQGNENLSTQGPYQSCV